MLCKMGHVMLQNIDPLSNMHVQVVTIQPDLCFCVKPMLYFWQRVYDAMNPVPYPTQWPEMPIL